MYTYYLDFDVFTLYYNIYNLVKYMYYCHYSKHYVSSASNKLYIECFIQLEATPFHFRCFREVTGSRFI